METNACQDTWGIYTQAWGESDPAKRLRLFEQSLSPECWYIDPLADVQGYEQLAAYMTELHKNVRGVRFVTTSFKTHHQHSLTHWNMVDGTGQVLSRGVSYGRYGADGRLLQMTGFYEAEAA